MRYLLIIISILCMGRTCIAATLTVNLDGSADYTSINDALSEAGAGDVVYVAAGVYVENIILPNGIELQGQIIGDKPDDTIIDGGGKGSVIMILGCDPSTKVQGFTIQNGVGTIYADVPNPSTSLGGGIIVGDSSPIIRECLIRNNSADIGGGLACVQNSHVQVSNCVFGNNTANLYGGGMACYESGPTVEGCTFTNNHCLNDGGALWVYLNSLSIIRHCVFEHNIAGDDGGGVYSWDNSQCIAEDCVFRSNTSGDKAGAFYSDTYDMSSFARCLFINNQAKYYGGAMYLFNNSTQTMYNCRFLGNSANNSGGAIRCYSECTLTAVNCIFNFNMDWGWGGAVECRNSSNAHLTNCTFLHNFAMVGGAVAQREQSSAWIKNCIFWDNTTSGNGDQLSTASSELHISYCVVEGGAEYIYNEDAQGIIHYDSVTNITSDPMLVDGNGPDDTFGTEDDNPRLRAGSPCIDMGDNGSIPEEVVYDFDNFIRIVDGDCNRSMLVDIGAYEFNHAVKGDFDGDCDTDLNDFAILSNSWLSEEGSANWNPMCNRIDFSEIIIDLSDLSLWSECWLWKGY